ncbi:MAG: MerR family transcriptional regulator [Acidobacteria bacterium]|nr:MerR family transcriptional regulator [Acidobacteriota bacterium]
MADEAGSHLSIAEVLGILLVEFPDVTISKIRILESQGLIEPERTPSGYRKFSREDVDRLRGILRQQAGPERKLSVLPPVDDSTGAWVPVDATDASGDLIAPYDDSSPAGMSTPSPAHPAARSGHVAPPPPPPPVPGTARADEPDPAVVELAAAAGLIRNRKQRGGGPLTQLEVTLVDLATRYSALGIDVRHLRLLKQGAEREALLYEQRVAPYLRQKNPAARQEAAVVLDELAALGLELRNVLMTAALERVTDGL